jgi:hypothetical protein
MKYEYYLTIFKDGTAEKKHTKMHTHKTNAKPIYIGISWRWKNTR